MAGFYEINAGVLINSEDLRRRFKEVRELVYEKGNVGVLVNNRVDMVLMDMNVYNELMAYRNKEAQS